jgi:adenylate cyclase class IV
MSHYEIEVKVLLGHEEAANSLLKLVDSVWLSPKLIGENAQLNHYFVHDKTEDFLTQVEKVLHPDEKGKFHHIMKAGKKHSIRTREVDGDTLLVVKASVDDTTSENGVARLEWEYVFPKKPIQEVDDIILSSGGEYQAKWSRSRREYELGNGMHLCLDKNAGYGYLAEFEKITHDPEGIDTIKSEILWLIERLGHQELDQGKLARMFDHYNKNWREYYGTEKVFTID